MASADAIPHRRPRVLLLCTGNSCRTQMAEGWAHATLHDAVEVHSAGIAPHGVDPRAVRAMGEVGIDISRHRSKRPSEVPGALDLSFDLVVTLCDAAHESCPVFPGARVMHVGFDDPPRLAAGATSDEAAMAHYRRVRDELRSFIERLPALVAAPRQKATSMTDQRPTVNTESCCSDDCCGGPRAAREASADALREKVREGYAKIATEGGWSAGVSQATSTEFAKPAGGCCGGGGCCGPATFTPEALAAAIGYSQGDLAATPEGANMGLSCGNPTAIASLRSGEVVLDLGSGGGFDCFVAGPKVGAAGKVIGVDMTPDMLSKARRNASQYREQTGLDNVEFRLGEIEHLPVADDSVDVVISNCVLNLSPDKPQVWREIARVLKPGGRVAVSDLSLVRALPEAVRRDVEALVGCVAGAVLLEDTRRFAAAAGLTEIILTAKPEYIDAMTNWEDPLYRKIVASLPEGSKPSDFITSLDVSARKPRR